MVISKKVKFFFILINVLVLNSFYSSFGNMIANQTGGVWLSFELQRCGPLFLILYDHEEGENQDFVVDVKIANQSYNAQLKIVSIRKVEEKTPIVVTTDYFAISEKGSESITFSSIRFGLQLDTALNDTIKHSITVSGEYRINNGEWQAFELQKCFPLEVKIFEDLKFEYNLTIDLKIIELTGVLRLEYGVSDITDSFDFPEIGEYSSNITAHYVSLYIDSIEEFGSAAGLYKVTTFDRSPIANMIGFESFFVLSILALLYVTKWKN